MKRSLTLLTALSAALLCTACEPSATSSSSSTAPTNPSATSAPTGATPTSSAEVPPATTSMPVKVTADKPADGAAAANNAFAFDLLKQLRKQPDGANGNMAYSPASISLALAMTYGGAKGETAAQMAKVLHLPAGEGYGAPTHGSWQTVLASWQADGKPYELAVANRLFGQKSFTFEQGFLDLTKRSYAAPLELRDFAGNPEAERNYINGWVEQQTKKRIKDLIPPLGITSDTRMVLTNAIYFKAQWQEPFAEQITADGDFFTASGKVTAKMMTKGQRARHAEVDGVQILELPYKGGDFSMLWLLPKEKDGLAKLEEGLTADKLDGWVGQLKWQQVTVTVPRFKIDPPKSLALKKVLSEMGMPLAFKRGAADFTGMANPPAPDDRLSIGDVFHKAFVEVDEKGTEAAAATAVTMMRAGSAAPAKPIAFKADHPFLFILYDRKNNVVAFVGRVADPS